MAHKKQQKVFARCYCRLFAYDAAGFTLAMIPAILSVTLLLCLPVYAQVEKSQSAVDFVQGFYAWYAPFAQGEHKGPAFESAIKRNAAIFSEELRRALMSDAAAQSKVSGWIVGVDFDPFLNSQDPANGYQIGKVNKKGSHQLFHLHAVTESRKQPKPTVVAEVEKQSGNWVFVNFHYPDGGDLLSTLKNLSASRGTKSGG